MYIIRNVCVSAFIKGVNWTEPTTKHMAAASNDCKMLLKRTKHDDASMLQVTVTADLF